MANIVVVDHLREYREINKLILAERDGMQQVLMITDRIVKSQLNIYLLLRFSINLYGSRDTSISEVTETILAGVKSHIVCTALNMAKEVLSTNTITTFNVAEAMLNRGYTMEYFTGKEVFTAKMRGKAFEKKFSEGVRFQSGTTVINVPTSCDFIDTNYLPEQPKTVIAQFKSVLATSVQIVASYNAIINDIVKPVNFSPDAKVLTGIDSILRFGGTTAAAMLLNDHIQDRKRKQSIKLPTTLVGAKLAHEAYDALVSAISYDTLLEREWVTKFNSCFLSPMIDVIKDQGRTMYGLIYQSPEIPLSFQDLSFDVTQKNISISQAYDANRVARTVRGENDSENAVFSRIANVPFTVPYRVGEACSMKANYSRYYTGATKIFIDADKTVAQVVIADLLDALAMDDYDGEVYIPSYASKIVGVYADLKETDTPKSYAEMQRLNYKYRHSPMKLLLYVPEYTQAFRESFDASVLVIDLKVIANTEGRYSTVCGAVNHLGSIRKKFHDAFNYNYVFQIPFVDGMSDWIYDSKGETEYFLRSSYQMTNLMCYFSSILPDKKDAWSYNLLDHKEIAMYCSAASLMTILRCIYKFTGKRPNSYLKHFGFRELPVMVRGMAKIGSNVLLTLKLEAGKFEDMDLEEVRMLFDTSDESTRSIIASTHPDLLQKAFPAPSSSTPSTFSAPQIDNAPKKSLKINYESVLGDDEDASDTVQ